MVCPLRNSLQKQATRTSYAQLSNRIAIETEIILQPVNLPEEEDRWEEGNCKQSTAEKVSRKDAAGNSG